MSLDFNTLEPIKEPVNYISNISDNNGPNSSVSGPISRFQTFLLIAAFLFSVLALVGVLYTLAHIPKPEPVSIQCSPDLLKKIENQAKVLEEIARTTKPKN